MRADLHVHTHASSKPVYPALKRLGCPECFSAPERVYEMARARGMDFVAVTDHDTIDGAMELVERGCDGVIVGEEVTVHFPEDQCRLHVLVWGISPEQHEQIETLGLRKDVYAFSDWLREQKLAHALAHPLCAQNGRLTREKLERCFLLFDAFETLNGAHTTWRQRELVERLLDSLTDAKLTALAARYGMAAPAPGSSRKARTGGSDDHAMLSLARTWTGVPLLERERMVSPEVFLRRLMAGRGVPGGAEASAAGVAHQVATVGAHFYSKRFHEGADAHTQALASRLARFAGVEARRPTRKELWIEAIRRRTPLSRRRSLPLTRALRECLPQALEAFPDLRSRLTPDADGPPMGEHERMAELFDSLAPKLATALAPELSRALRKGDRAGVADVAMSFAVMAAAQAPHVGMLFYQNKERRLLDELERSLDGARGEREEPARGLRVAVFTDTLGDVNGVARFVRDMAGQAEASGRELHVFTSTRVNVEPGPNIHCFEPVLARKIPRYEHLEVVAPPVTAMLRRVDALQPDIVHVSTPGPVGMTGLLAAKMLRAPVVGVHHTDFPAYVRMLFDDAALGQAAAKLLGLMYERFSTVLTRTRGSIESVEALGVERSRIRAFTPGVDVETFHTRRADPAVWRGCAGVSPTSVKVLSIGRVSVEKNMPLLEKAWRKAHTELVARGVEAELIVVGDGPHRKRMEKALRGRGAHFLGFRHGEELSAIYASSDVFVFPSETDTLGQVALEAQASGLPVLVSDRGGPREVVEDGVTGLVLPGDDAERWAGAIVEMVVDGERRRRMGADAHLHAQQYSRERSFQDYWMAHVEAWRGAGVREEAVATPASLWRSRPLTPAR
ncbi:MAG: glycosyltransferase [Phycisphaeraceae bacterium]|nr:MAG: glycosyltransferase [Phycisphaeraceae bacterium]